MSLESSRRLSGHVVFHCPSCFADRLGRVRTGRWRPWPSDVQQTGRYVECAACQAQTSG